MLENVTALFPERVRDGHDPSRETVTRIESRAATSSNGDAEPSGDNLLTILYCAFAALNGRAGRHPTSPRQRADSQ